MGVLVVRIEDGGVVNVERRATPLIDFGKGAKTVVDLVRKGEGPNPVKAAEEVSDFVLALYFIERADHLSADERAAARRVLYTFDPTFDSIRFDRAAADESARGGAQAADGPPDAPREGIVWGIVDP